MTCANMKEQIKDKHTKRNLNQTSRQKCKNC